MSTNIQHPHVLVTAIYNYSPFSRMGGRGYDVNYYKAPFFNIIKLGLPIVIFTHEEQREPIENFLAEVNAENYQIIVYDLETTDITNIVLGLKEQSKIIDERGLIQGLPIIFNDRNHVLCLKKLYFLKHAIENNLFNGEKYYWIDAGLFHHGLFPETFGGKEKFTRVQEDTYWPANEANIFRPGLLEKLSSNSQQDFILIKTNAIYGPPSWWSTLTSHIQPIGHVVGGLFGGNIEIIMDMYEEFNSHMYELFNNKILPLEEEILSWIYAEKYAHFNVYEFDAWVHDIPTDPCYTGNPKTIRCFYKIFM